MARGADRDGHPTPWRRRCPRRIKELAQIVTDALGVGSAKENVEAGAKSENMRRSAHRKAVRPSDLEPTDPGNVRHGILTV
jgi:hypothetical protein